MRSKRVFEGSNRCYIQEGSGRKARVRWKTGGNNNALEDGRRVRFRASRA